MNKRVIVFAGTNEGREICEYLCENGIETTACVATDYGSFCIENVEHLQVLEGRLDKEQIQELISGYDYVVDASHPYAQVISENIEIAYKACMEKTKKIRIIRESQEEKGRVFHGFEEVCEFLSDTEGNVLVTTGSKDLHYFQKIEGYKERVFLRILPAIESLENAIHLGFKKSNIICMQGPFSLEMNMAMIRNIDAKYLVSKDTGKSGGFAEKVLAAKQTGTSLLTIGRPYVEEGLTLEEAKRYFSEELNVRKVAL